MQKVDIFLFVYLFIYFKSTPVVDQSELERIQSKRCSACRGCQKKKIYSACTSCLKMRVKHLPFYFKHTAGR